MASRSSMTSDSGVSPGVENDGQRFKDITLHRLLTVRRVSDKNGSRNDATVRIYSTGTGTSPCNGVHVGTFYRYNGEHSCPHRARSACDARLLQPHNRMVAAGVVVHGRVAGGDSDTRSPRSASMQPLDVHHRSRIRRGRVCPRQRRTARSQGSDPWRRLRVAIDGTDFGVVCDTGCGCDRVGGAWLSARRAIGRMRAPRASGVRINSGGGL